MFLSENDDHIFAAQARAGQDAEPRLGLIGNGERSANIEAELHRRAGLVDMLTTGTACPHGAHADFALRGGKPEGVAGDEAQAS